METCVRVPLFREWLIKKCLSNGDVRGYNSQCLFAKIVYKDIDFPRFKDFSIRRQKRIIMNYLLSCHAGKKTMKTFFSCWEDYLNYIDGEFLKALKN